MARSTLASREIRSERYGDFNLQNSHPRQSIQLPVIRPLGPKLRANGAVYEIASGPIRAKSTVYKQTHLLTNCEANCHVYDNSEKTV